MTDNLGLFLALREHILGVIAAIHVQACRQVGQQQSSGAAAQVQRGLSKRIDHRAEIGSLLPAIGLKLSPVPGNQTVMPNLWLCHFLLVSFSIKSKLSGRRAMALRPDELFVFDLSAPEALHLFAGRKQVVQLAL